MRFVSAKHHGELPVSLLIFAASMKLFYSECDPFMETSSASFTICEMQSVYHRSSPEPLMKSYSSIEKEFNKDGLGLSKLTAGATIGTEIENELVVEWSLEGLT